MAPTPPTGHTGYYKGLAEKISVRAIEKMQCPGSPVQRPNAATLSRDKDHGHSSVGVLLSPFRAAECKPFVERYVYALSTRHQVIGYVSKGGVVIPVAKCNDNNEENNTEGTTCIVVKNRRRL